MSWLTKIEPLVLYQSSDIPYVILEDGVHLCFDNLFQVTSQDRDDHNITFKFSRNGTKRKSSNYHRILSFPVTIPFSDVLGLNKCVIEGRLVKSASERKDGLCSVALVTSSHIRRLDDDEFQEFVDSLDRFSESFVLVGDQVDPQVRILDDFVTPIYHAGDWGRTCVSIANSLCQLPDRKYCWTRSIPEIDLACFGLREVDHMNKVSNIFNEIGIPVGTSWEG